MEKPMEIFKSEDGKIQVNVIIENETAWLTQAAMALQSSMETGF